MIKRQIEANQNIIAQALLRELVPRKGPRPDISDPKVFNRVAESVSSRSAWRLSQVKQVLNALSVKKQIEQGDVRGESEVASNFTSLLRKGKTLSQARDETARRFLLSHEETGGIISRALKSEQDALRVDTEITRGFTRQRGRGSLRATTALLDALKTKGRTRKGRRGPA